jgi:hypothetical protein
MAYQTLSAQSLGYRQPFLFRTPASHPLGAASFPLQTVRQPLPNGPAGLARTLKAMEAFVEGAEGATNARVRALALQIVHGTSERDDAGQASAIYQWVKSNIEFRGEWNETLQTPLATLIVQAGDCDDQSMLVAALLRAIGIETQFTTVSADSSAPGEMSHVYAEYYDRNSQQWTALDTTVANAYPGWKPPLVFASQSWPTARNLSIKKPTAVQAGNVDLGRLRAMRVLAMRRRLGRLGDDLIPGVDDMTGATDPLSIPSGDVMTSGGLTPISSLPSVGTSLTASTALQNSLPGAITSMAQGAMNAVAAATRQTPSVSVLPSSVGSLSMGTLMLLGGVALVAVMAMRK